MQFGSPENSIYMISLPLLIVGMIVQSFRHKKALKSMIDEALWQTVLPTVSVTRRFWKAVLWSLVLFMVCLCLLRPQYGEKTEIRHQKGRDIIVLLDVSLSMQTPDINPNRLEYAKREIENLADQLKGDRIGLVIVAGDAFVQCPLTADYGAFKLFLKQVSVQSMALQGTDLSKGIEVATAALLRQKQKTEKIMIVLTDGESLEADPVEAAEKSGSLVKIMTIGIGTAEGDPIPMYGGNNQLMGYKKTRENEVVVSKLNESMLKDIAQKGKGLYFNPQRQYGVMDQVYKAISEKEAAVIKAIQVKRYQDRYQWILAIACLCLIVETLISERKRVKK